MEYRRYAIYYTPAPGPLGDMCSAWLGWDMVHGRDLPHPQVPGLPLPVSQITETPRKYGLHATMKPPFRLAHGATPAMLDAALASFCAQRPAVTLEGLELARLGRFLALRPLGDEGPLNALAADTVRGFDAFRAPLTEAELTRRREAGLTPEQDALLRAWGYPYVMDQFRFHITLTGKLPVAQARQTALALAPVLTPLLPAPFVIDALSLAGEDAQGRFHLISRHAFTG
jgi:putative phosphonate metabolism protein